MARQYQILIASAASIALLAACETQEAGTDDTITVTGTRTAEDADGYAQDAPAPPAAEIAESAPVASLRSGGGNLIGKVSPPPPRQPMPGDIDRERYEDVEINPVKLVTQAPFSTFSIDVDTTSYANARRYLNNGVLPPKDAVRIEELINYFDYAYPVPGKGGAPFSTSVTVVPSPWAEGKNLIQIGVQGYEIIPEKRPPLNLTLLVDVSGSMRAENKLPLARKALRMLIDELGPEDHVAIAVYAGAAGEILAPTPGNEKAKIMAALDNLSAGGSTAGGEGLRLAYSLAEQNFNKEGVNRVMLLTDGDFNVGIADPERLEDFVSRKRESGVYLSVLGFGQGNYNDVLMQKIAQTGNGTASYIDSLNEARKVLSDEVASNLFTIADDVKIQVEFNPAKIAGYRLLGYETRLLKREDFNNDQVDAGEIGSGASVTAIYEVTPVDSKARLIDPSRYVAAQPLPENRLEGEFGYLRLRYKKPGEDTSYLVEKAITEHDGFATIGDAPARTRFATAVAAYGQLLRGDPYIARDFGWDEVISLASSAKGEDAFGYRAEFIQLARAARTAAAQARLEPEGTGAPN